MDSLSLYIPLSEKDTTIFAIILQIENLAHCQAFLLLYYFLINSRRLRRNILPVEIGRASCRGKSVARGGGRGIEQTNETVGVVKGGGGTAEYDIAHYAYEGQ